MERERMKTLLLPFKNGWFNGYYQRFEQRAQDLDQSSLEKQLESPTYTHQLREMFIRFGVGVAVFSAVNRLIQPSMDDNISLQIAYLFSLGPQYMAMIVPSVTRSIVVQREQQILQQTLGAKRQTI